MAHGNKTRIFCDSFAQRMYWSSSEVALLQSNPVSSFATCLVKDNVFASFDYFMCRADFWLLPEASDAVGSVSAPQSFYGQIGSVSCPSCCRKETKKSVAAYAEESNSGRTGKASPCSQAKHTVLYNSVKKILQSVLQHVSCAEHIRGAPAARAGPQWRHRARH
jgi:hypothetical protein